MARAHSKRSIGRLAMLGSRNLGLAQKHSTQPFTTFETDRSPLIGQYCSRMLANKARGELVATWHYYWRASLICKFFEVSTNSKEAKCIYEGQ